MSRRPRLYRLLRKALELSPLRWRLALWLKIAATCHLIEIELRELEKLPASGKVAVDIGANFGSYSYVMARHFDRVLAFEPNPQTTGWLTAAQLSNVEMIGTGLTSPDHVGSDELSVPVADGVVMHGWGSLNFQSKLKYDHVNRYPVQLETLDSHQLTDVGMIKIDVEGHEAQVLKGAKETIQRCRPTLIVEVIDANLAEVDQWLNRLDYQHCPPEALFSKAAIASTVQPNRVYLPSERSRR